MDWFRAASVALALAVVAGAGCGSAPHLTMYVTSAGADSLDVSIVNTGDSTSGPLTLTLDSAGVFFVNSDLCSGQTLGSGAHCGVRIGFPVATIDQPQGSLAAADGRGAHASTTLTATKSVGRLMLASRNGRMDVREGTTVDSNFDLQNTGGVTTGPITLDFPGTIVADQCSGATLTPYAFCKFQVEYTSPLGQKPQLVRISGTIVADPGGTVPLDAYFNVLGLLFQAGPNFGYGEPPGDTVYWQIGNASDNTSIGPLQLSFEYASGNPPIDYPPFYLVSGMDMCTGQTLTGQSTQNRECGLVIGLDPRLPAGGTYSATLHVDGGNEILDVPISATRNNQ
jgi:hypothetical protein